MIGPLPYIGGKNRLARQIISLLPEHTTYVEPFCGGAQVFFHKQPSEVEVLNDLDFDVVNFLRVCQHHYEEFLRHLRYVAVSRKWYELLEATDPSTLTDIQRAVRFFYLQKNSFGGLVLKRHYHYGVTQRPNYRPERVASAIDAAHRRLLNAQIESLPYEDILKKYDRPATLFYLDPPYWGPKLYRFNFAEEDFQHMANRLERLKGKFILSLNDRSEVRKTFSRFRIKATDLSYSAQPGIGKRYAELLITNFDQT
jgi:DNA adenine methylase